jgi:biotin synthase-related radical SAM superfamily protein
MQLTGDALERSPVPLSRYLPLREVRSLLGKAEAALQASKGDSEVTNERVQVG